MALTSACIDEKLGAALVRGDLIAIEYLFILQNTEIQNTVLQGIPNERNSLMRSSELSNRKGFNERCCMIFLDELFYIIILKCIFLFKQFFSD